MEAELKELKSMLRSLVVSSAAAVDAATLARDYRNIIGQAMPYAKFGYRDHVSFLRERCTDCFLGSHKNPSLTLIVPDSLKHIDNLVQKQRTTGIQGRFKRRSVPESVVKPVKPAKPANSAIPMQPSHDSMIVNSFRKKSVKQDTEVSSTNQSSAAPVNSFVRKKIPLSESSQAAECAEKTNTYREERPGCTPVPWAARPGSAGAACAAPAPSPAPSSAPSSASCQSVRAQFHRPASPPTDIDDALPGVPYEAGVFPADCLHYMETIPAVGVADLRVHDTIHVITAEVYSPSHLWLIRLGEQYNEAMERVMDEMNEYYRGEGRDRELVVGAVRVGHHVACCYQGDWHRALIVRVVDCDTVKVRHVDYGTVQLAAARALRPLRRGWARLPAQALRARLAGVRPVRAQRRWHHAAARQLLRLLRDRPLAAAVAAVDRQEEIIEVYLTDRSSGQEVEIHRELIDSGHAEAAGGAHTAGAAYSWPSFGALEAAATPALHELLAFERAGVDPECLHDYRAHVPPLLPPPMPPMSGVEREVLAQLARLQPGLARRYLARRALTRADPR